MVFTASLVACSWHFDDDRYCMECDVCSELTCGALLNGLRESLDSNRCGCGVFYMLKYDTQKQPKCLIAHIPLALTVSTMALKLSGSVTAKSANT